jgi:hypothetical protein
MTTEENSADVEAERKAALFANDYVSTIESAVPDVMDDDLRRIVRNAYATAYLRGRVDAAEECMKTFEPQFQVLADRIAVLERQLGNVQ